MSTENIPRSCQKIYENYKNCLKDTKMPSRDDSQHLLCALSGPCMLKRNNCAYQSAILTICLRRVKYGSFI